jgi:hypothetical protein
MQYGDEHGHTGLTDSRQAVMTQAMKKVMYVLEERQIQALRAEAFRRAEERGRGSPDASEVLREVLEAWLAEPRSRPRVRRAGGRDATARRPA